MRGSTTRTRTTVQTRTALNSGTKPGSLLLGTPYPWDAFRPEHGAATLARRLLRYRGKRPPYQTGPAVVAGLGSPQEGVQDAAGGRRQIGIEAVKTPQAPLLDLDEAGR